MATYQQWSQSYFDDLTLKEHIINNEWFDNMLTMLKDDGILYVPILDKEFNKLGEEVTQWLRNLLLQVLRKILIDLTM